MPSDTDPGEPDDDASELDEEQVAGLVARIADDARKIGLYYVGTVVMEDSSTEEEREGDPSHHRIMIQFNVGDIAFADRVQDPEAEKMKDQFREIESATLEEEIEAIRQQHRKRRGG